MQQIHCCDNGSSSTELAVVDEMTPDEITDRLSRLEITHDNGESAAGTSTETEDVEGEVCHRISQSNGEISNSTTNSNCAEALNIVDVSTDVNHDKDSIITNNNKHDDDDDDDEDTENGKVSAVTDCLSLLTLEVSAATDHVSDDQYQHVDDVSVETASECFDDVTVDETSRHGDDGAADEQLETDCVSVRLPEMSPITHCVPADLQQQHNANSGTTALIADCSHHGNVGDGFSNNGSDGTNDTDTASAAAGDNDEYLNLSSLMASSMYHVFITCK